MRIVITQLPNGTYQITEGQNKGQVFATKSEADTALQQINESTGVTNEVIYLESING